MLARSGRNPSSDSSLPASTRIRSTAWSDAAAPCRMCPPSGPTRRKLIRACVGAREAKHSATSELARATIPDARAALRRSLRRIIPNLPGPSARALNWFRSSALPGFPLAESYFYVRAHGYASRHKALITAALPAVRVASPSRTAASSIPPQPRADSRAHRRAAAADCRCAGDRACACRCWTEKIPSLEWHRAHVDSTTGPTRYCMFWRAPPMESCVRRYSRSSLVIACRPPVRPESSSRRRITNRERSAARRSCPASSRPACRRPSSRRAAVLPA